ncbi:DUF2254 domain-containing protein [Geminicoccus harenae]|uniref:DUF2254 domain-containing protein n=1 Tax=Geminicoccus harenae TaxID=2498453 RepID=UPI00168A80CA|nr:DUF2254 domain-containing protein [Geminicoccus harenae]
MHSRLAIVRDRLQTGLWPIPIGMILLTIPLYAATSWIDARIGDASGLLGGWLHSGSGDDARNLLSTLLSALITMATMVFSITIAALSIAAGQFGSRLIRTYMEDIRTKLAVGLFTMAIMYCFLALRSVGKDMPAAEVPHVLVSTGLGLGLVCVLFLLFFLHAVARSILVDEIIRRVAHELEENIEALAPLGEPSDEVPVEQVWPPGVEHKAALLSSRRGGYVQAVEHDRLVEFASRHSMLIHLEFRPGNFMSEGDLLVRVHPADALTPETAAAIQEAILIGSQRTPTQDLEFTMRHLVDIALRALSPGINDPNTALVVVDHLQGGLSRLMGKAIPPAIHRDETGEPRVIDRPNGYAGLLAASLHQIRQAAASQPAVIIGMLRAIGRIAEHVRLAEQREALLHHARLICAAGLRETAEPADRDDIEAAFAATERKLGQVLPRRPQPAGDGLELDLVR